MAFLGPLPDDLLLVRHVQGIERLSECFEYVLTLYSTSPNIQAEALLGRHCGVHLRFGGQERYFDGIGCDFAHLGRVGRHSTYRLVLRPWFWLLSRNRRYRVFQGLTSMELTEKLIQEAGFASDLDVRLVRLGYGDPIPREYCVQYGESDLNFIQRLLEDDGIYYHFKHERNRHVLVFCNATGSHGRAPGCARLQYKRDPESAGSVSSWTSSKSVQAGRVTLRDYDFTKPSVDLLAATASAREHEHANAEIYEYPGDYCDIAVGEGRSRVRLEEIQSDYDLSEGTTDASALYAGALFELEHHPRECDNREYLITALSFDADSGSFASGDAANFNFTSHVRGLGTATPFRPSRTTPRPRVIGVQTATVVGKQGSEIWTDVYGRVKVQFHWDREGERNEASSSWVRVAQLWTGNRWGSLHVPRVGQEVVVEFLDGDPDRPLVIGCVYNFNNKPPFISGPDEHPSHATQVGIRTQSTPEANPNEANALYFDDKKGSERLVVRAQRDMITTVEHDARTTVSHDESHRVQGKLTLTVAQGELVTDVQKSAMRTLVPNAEYALDAKKIVENAGESIDLAVGDCRLVVSKSGIQLTVPGSSICLNDRGVTIANGLGPAQNHVSLDSSGVSIDGQPTIRLNTP